MDGGWLNVLVIPKVTPSANVTKREHWRATSKRASEWMQEIFVQMSQDKRIKERGPYDRVHVVSYRMKMLDGFDNLPGGMKEIIPDNLKKLGLIEDDADRYCSITCEQVVGDKPYRTVIRLGFRKDIPWKKKIMKQILG